jgi:hypothetical protein
MRRVPARRRPLTLLTMALLGVVGCEEACPGELVVIAPKLNVSVCAEPQEEVEGEFVGGYEECALDFGPSDISVRKSLEVVLTNATSVNLSGPDESPEDALDIFLSTDTDPAFTLEAKPTIVEAGLQKSVLVSYRPNTESSHEGKLVIKSDAANIPTGQDVVIPITGTGVDNGIPDISVDTLRCNFGRVAAGSVAQCNVEIANNGTRALVFDGVNFLTESDGGDPLPNVPSTSTLAPFGFFGRPPAAEDVVAAPPEVNTVNLAIRFTPDVLGAYVGQVEILSNDPDQPRIVVDLDGVGVDPPVCTIKVESVNGNPVTGVPVIEPLDDVIVSAEDSVASTATGSITQFEWELIEKPQGSTADFVDRFGMSTGFRFADVVGVDLAGRYRVRAKVIDDMGTTSVNECELAFEAIPSDSFLVQLTWDTSVGDMDLHVTKKNDSGDFCPSGVEVGPLSQDCGSQDDDCYYANCNPNDSRPDWDNDGSSDSPGDPSLDIDDLSGYGPENTNIDLAVEGEYLVGVDYFSSSGGATGNTIRIYIYGQLQAEFYKELSNGNFWEVAVIKWPASGLGAPCIEDLSTTAEECP